MGLFGDIFKGFRAGSSTANVTRILKISYGFTPNYDKLTGMLMGYNGQCTEHTIAVMFLTEHLRCNAEKIKAKFPADGLLKNFESYIQTTVKMKDAGLLGSNAEKVIDDLIAVAGMEYGILVHTF